MVRGMNRTRELVPAASFNPSMLLLVASIHFAVSQAQKSVRFLRRGFLLARMAFLLETRHMGCEGFGRGRGGSQSPGQLPASLLGWRL